MFRQGNVSASNSSHLLSRNSERRSFGWVSCFLVFLDVLSSWVMLPLRLTESICCNRCVYLNELSPEIWKWPHRGLLQVEITELASFWISPSIFLNCCELKIVQRVDKEQNKCCLPASLHCRCVLKQDYFLAGRIEVCLAQGREQGG